jgi:putative restriction endonuclease
MRAGTILGRFDSLNIYKRGGQRAPHKPLLVLYALGRWTRGEADTPFSDADPALASLLKEFGTSKSLHPEYPFWRLQNDGVWVVRAQGKMRARKSNTDPPKKELLDHQAVGSFSDDVQAALRAEPALVTQIASRMLDGHFPDTIHEDILAAVGLTLETGPAASKKRDPAFRKKVLVAYEYRCAVCHLDVRLDQLSIALEAAHIRWHQYGGPDEESNGLALCVLHHKLFDLGAFTVSRKGYVQVSDRVHGSSGLDEVLLRHHGAPVREPQRLDWGPDARHLAWHKKEVFKGESRHQDGPTG